MRTIFEKQINFFPTITDDILEKMEYKTVWSGKRIIVGDKILYAYVYSLNTDDLKLIYFLERELGEISKKFKFHKYHDDETPILIFNNDTKKRD